MRGQIPILTVTHRATAAIAAEHFITFAGAPAGAADVSGTTILGVVQSDAAAGDDVPVGVLGVLKVKTGAAVTKDSKIVSDASGRAIPSATGAFGVALHDAVAGGTVQILVR